MNMLSKVIDQQKTQFTNPSAPPDMEPLQVENAPYVNNMRALCKHSPILAHKIDSVDELDFIPCEKTRSGEWTCQWTGPNNRNVFLHSRYNPTREAQRWADGVEELAKSQIDEDSGKVPMCYFVDGLGLGYHVRELYDQLEGEAFIVVSEPNVAMIRTALEHFDFSKMLMDERLVFITADDRAEIFKRLQQHSHVMMMGVVFTHPLQRIETEFHARVHTLISEYTAFMRANLWTLLGCSLQTCKNVIHNLPTYVSTPSIDILQKRFAGCPAVLVSAGPSLRQNIELLKKIRDRVVVIAVQTVLKPLLASGIEPDFVTSLDFADICKRFFDGLENLPNVHLVAEPKAHWDVIDIYRSIGPMTLLGNEFASLLLEGQTDDHDCLVAGT
ncbi:MAG: motility associated factor glycosyltransferase family protein, partial [Planctomycetes bacterium]|nr:motility associated factor glycosyltransferase family protein [Planctomycetota bacterium]